ncbi:MULTISPECIES: DUF1206 domain-containing protein [Sphingomonas]|uniref:DUF1206 domain-containing protein n=1 Tax=Sphingomonas TaxID=13687 RepID=UPI000DEFD352|nr:MULTISPECIES: DUF1206 domain-containing protein [Sphingomonas]
MPTDASTTLTLLTRFGFAARGVMYLVIAWLIIAVGRAADPSGALHYLSTGRTKWLLLVMIAGFVAYGVWRLSDALLNIEGHKPGRKGWGPRAAAAFSGAVHLAFAWQAIRFLRGVRGEHLSGAKEGAMVAMDLPGGAWLLLLGGAVLAGVGIAQFVNAWRCKFCERLGGGVRSAPWVRWTGRGGYLARGIVFLISGYFLYRAGMDSRATEAGGMQQALAWLTSPWDVIVGVGLALFGCFSLIEARYRVIHDVPVEEVASKARQHLSV